MPDLQGSKILHFKQARIPELRFEWHPVCQIVYVIQKDTIVIQADPIAWNIKTHGDAWNTVLIFCRGYIAHKIGFATLTSVEQREEGKANGKPVHA